MYHRHDPAIGANYLGNGRFLFRVWAPLTDKVALHLSRIAEVLSTFPSGFPYAARKSQLRTSEHLLSRTSQFARAAISERAHRR